MRSRVNMPGQGRLIVLSDQGLSREDAIPIADRAVSDSLKIPLKANTALKQIPMVEKMSNILITK